MQTEEYGDDALWGNTYIGRRAIHGEGSGTPLGICGGFLDFPLGGIHPKVKFTQDTHEEGVYTEMD